MSSETMTPMMRQYRSIKSELPEDVILFFRLGDFYEMFFEDARIAAPILDITLTRRNDVPMCGVPYHAVDSYIARLIKAGRKVAICDQVEDPALAKGIVKREVDRIVTPGTATADDMLESNKHNFLVAVNPQDNGFGVAVLDLSTGLFWGEEQSGAAGVRDLFLRISPSECLVAENRKDDPSFKIMVAAPFSGQVTVCDGWAFEKEAARDTMIRHFNVQSLEGFGCEGKPGIVGAAGGMLTYVKERLRHKTGHIRSFSVRSQSDFLILDENTVGNLNIVPVAGQPSLLKVLDSTRTPMGARKLRDWLVQPLARLAPITERHDAVDAMKSDRAFLAELRESLGAVRDMERLIARAGAGLGTARDIAAIGQSMGSLPGVRQILGVRENKLLGRLKDAMVEKPELVKRISETLVDAPPLTLKDGGLIRAGYNAELDELRGAASSGRNWLAEYQTREQQRTGIKTLKVRHNRVFGYYIEISKGQALNVPQEYMRKQTLVNAERFTTPELKEYEEKIIGAQDKANALEYEIYEELRQVVLADTEAIQTAAEALAQVDALASLADRALANRYVRPVMSENGILTIGEGRHPVIEAMPDAERFVPNDTLLDIDTNRLAVITGPNMAGKSTYIRQVAMIVIMAHAGSFVPASGAEIGLVDRVFTRVGASDDLARGRSTFLVEMQETASILNHATERSLIVLDEIGRGTSTFDGISIAWAVAEHLHNKIKAKTLFATHYHELTDLAMTLPGVKNYNVLVREDGERIAFLRRIVPGAADKSYGIHVAGLAGLPGEVVERAREILANLEEGELAETGQPKIAKSRGSRTISRDQMLLFTEETNGAARQRRIGARKI